MNKSTTKYFQSFTRLAQVMLIVVALLAIGLTQSAWADFTYTYTGNSFSYVGTGPDVTNVSGSFSVLSPLAANTIYTLTPTTVGGTITSYNFTDGRSNWNIGNYDANGYNGQGNWLLSVTTNASRNIVSWYLQIFSTSGSINSFNSTYYDNLYGTVVSDGTSVYYNYDAYNFGNPGTWTQSGTSPVPIPGAVWLLGSGLLGLVGIRRKFST